MDFEPSNFYHIYNRSFRNTKVFYNHSNFIYFLKKVAGLKGYCDILAYCLMPDHFHLLVYVSENTEGCTRQTAQSGLTGREGMQVLTRKIGTILSSYTQAINKQESSRGSLFQPKTKAKQLIETDHLLSCFNYIHQNPLSAGLVKKLEDWQYSSFNEYFNDTPGLCNQALARELPDFPRERKDFYNHSYNVINDPLLLKFIGLSPIR